jgi:Lar family restriction alleviation protein
MYEILQRCPFCGSMSVVVIEDEDGELVYCTACEGRGPSKATEAEAVEGWNRRAGASGEQA